MGFLESLIALESFDDPRSVVLHLVGPPHLTTSDERIEVPESCGRLLAYIATRGRAVDRRLAAGYLWPDGDKRRSGACLRTSLWRLNRTGLSLVVADEQTLDLSPQVVVDLRVVSAWAMRLTSNHPRPTDLEVDPPDIESMELFPGWYDDWALLERERFRNRVLHAAETLSGHLRQRGVTGLAVDTAISVVSADPLRESAQRVLIEAYLEEGNLVEARRCYDAYRVLLLQELGVEPGAEFTLLVNQSRPCALPRPRLSASAAVRDECRDHHPERIYDYENWRA